MTGLGALCCALMVVAGILAVRPSSPLLRNLSRFTRNGTLHTRNSPKGHETKVTPGARIAAAATGAFVAALAGGVVPVGPLATFIGAGAGALVPSLILDRRALVERRLAGRRVGAIVEWLEALVSSGRPPESALVLLASRPTGSGLLDAALADAASAYSLGAPFYAALAEAARVREIPALAVLASELERSREFGRGALVAIREQRELLRSRERARALDAASRVDGALMLVLVLCYLPALMLLVVVPLFLSVLSGLDVAVR